MPGLAEVDADAAAHRGHGHIHPQGEHAHPHNQQKRAEQEQHQRPRRQGDDGDAQQQYNGCDREDGREGLPDLFHELRIDAHGKSPSLPRGTRQNQIGISYRKF